MTNIVLNRNKKKILLVSIPLIILIILILPVKIPYSISTIAKVKPAKQWLIVKGADGKLITTLLNNFNGNVENYSVTQFERGDVVQFFLHKNIHAGIKVNQKDSIAFITSNLSEIEITQLKSELAAALAELKLSQSKEKESVINTEQQKLEFAKKQFEEQQNIFNRQKALYDKQLISQEEFELAKSSLDLFRINVDIATERLSTVQTGSKAEEIEFIKTRIQGLQNQIKAVESKFQKYYLLSPINGIVQRTYSTDTLMNIEDYDEMVAFLPVNKNYLNELKVGQKVFIKNEFTHSEYEGEIYDPQANENSSDEKHSIIIVKINSKNGFDSLGVNFYNAEILIDEYYPLEYIYSIIKNIFLFR